MNLWEDVYSKHKESGRGPMNQETTPNHVLSDLKDPVMGSAGARSFEEMYYRNRRMQQNDAANQHGQSQAQQPNATDTQVAQEMERQQKAIKKEIKSKYTPRRHSGTLSAPYPAILSKMSAGLSDTWSNIIIGSDQDTKTLLVCGSTRKEGNTLISYHLAMFLSKEYAMKVLYVDTNLNHEPIPRIKNLPGLYSFVSEGRDLATLVVKTDYPGLYLMPSGAGAIAKNLGSNMLTRESIEYLIQFCRDNFDIAVIDGQPLTLSPIMFEFAKKVDITLLVCRFGVSRQEVSKLAVEKLISCKTKSLGVVLNDRKFIVPQKFYKLLG